MSSLENPINESLVRKLLAAQMPLWAKLAVERVQTGGWCNDAFRLSDDKVIRLPRLPEYAPQAEKECTWLPKLAPHLPLAIPRPLAQGKPNDAFPWPWAVYEWIEGDVAIPDRINDMRAFAQSLAQFICALHRIDTKGAPLAGAHKFHRGGSLTVYGDQIIEAISKLRDRIDASLATDVWQRATETEWQQAPVWIHGDVSVGNLLVRNGKLAAVIDFGNMGIGDPACDLVIAWTIFDEESREGFRKTLAVDGETWARGRAWALWKALILAAEIGRDNAYEARDPWKIIDTALRDYAHEN